MRFVFFALVFIHFCYASQNTPSQQKLHVYINNWEPFTVVDTSKPEHLQIQGIAVDVWKQVAQKLSLEYEFIIVDKFTKVLKNLKNDPFGVAIATNLTEDRKTYALGTRTYNSFSIAIATKDYVNFQQNMDAFNGKTIAVGKNFTAHKLLEKYYPKIKLHLTKNTLEALDLVNSDRVFGAADILPVLTYNANKYHYDTIKISGLTRENYNIQILLNLKNEELIPHINTALDGFADDQIKQINNKWLYVKEHYIVDYTLIWAVLSVVLVVVVFLLLRYRYLYREKKLVENEQQKLKQLLENASDGIHIVDIKGDVVMCSKSFAYMLGYSYKEALSLNVADWEASVPSQKVSEAINDLFENPRSFQTKHRKKDGTLIDVQVNAKGIELDNTQYLYGSSRDITDILKLDELEVAQKIAKIGSWRYDVFLQVFRGSKQLKKIFDFDEQIEDISVETVLEKIFDEDKGKFLQTLQRTIAQNDVFDFSFRLLKSGNTMKYIDAKWQNVTDSRGQVTLLHGTVQDVTERTLAQQKEKELQTMLLQQSRLAQMGEMISLIAHQWRQPLNALNINIQNLDDDFTEGLIDSVFIEEFMTKNRDIITYMSDTIENFRNFFKSDKQMVKFELFESIQKALELLSGKILSNKVQVKLDIDRQLYIYGHTNEFSQVVLAILNNAIDQLSTLHAPLERKIQIQAISLEQSVQIDITDNGGGINESIIEKIFEPYTSTKGLNGTGLGLYMTKMIIENTMKGSVTASNAQSGACFRIILPVQL